MSSVSFETLAQYKKVLSLLLYFCYLSKNLLLRKDKQHELQQLWFTQYVLVKSLHEIIVRHYNMDSKVHSKQSIVINRLFYYMYTEFI